MPKKKTIFVRVSESELAAIAQEVHQHHDFLFENMPHTGLLACFVALHYIDDDERELLLRIPKSTTLPQET